MNAESEKYQEVEIGNAFDFIGETNITEEYAYLNPGIYPVYSGQTEDEGIFCKISTYKEETPCLIFTTYGKHAGTLSYGEGKFTIGRNCMGIRPKANFKDKIDLKWFYYTQKSLFIQHTKGDKDGQRSLNKIILSRVKFKLLKEKTDQEKLVLKYEGLPAKKDKLERINQKIGVLLSKQIRDNVAVNEKSVGTVFNVTSGVRVTEKEVYNNSGDLPIVTSQTTDEGITWMGSAEWLEKIKKKGQKVIVDKPCITWAKDGYAGKLFFRNYRFYPNDHCGILTVKDEYKDAINLRWFYYTQQSLFYSYVYGKSGQGMLYEKSVRRIKFSLSTDIKYQERIAEKYNKLEDVQKKVLVALSKIKWLMDKVIAT